jgi:hypothetical protein
MIDTDNFLFFIQQLYQKFQSFQDFAYFYLFLPSFKKKNWVRVRKFKKKTQKKKNALQKFYAHTLFTLIIIEEKL